MTFTCTLNDEGRRLDKILRKCLPDFPLSKIFSLIRCGDVLLDGKKTKPDIRVNENQIIEIRNVEIPGFHTETKAEDSLCCIPPFEIIFESDAILVSNKRAGIEVIGNDSLETAVSKYLQNKIQKSLSFKPGPLHRLDKPTSGLVIFGKSLSASRYISELLRKAGSEKIVKTYNAILDGKLEGTLNLNIAMYRNKELKKTFPLTVNIINKSTLHSTITRIKAQRHYKVNGKSFTYAEIQIDTGFTHQIRAACSYAGCPLSGDKKYGSITKINYPPSAFFLHAARIDFPKDPNRPAGIPDFLWAPKELPEKIFKSVF